MRNILEYMLCIVILLSCTGNICTGDNADKKDADYGKAESPVNANATVDKAKVTIGDRIQYTITADAPEDTEMVFPEMKEELAGFNVIDSGAEFIKSGEGRVREERWFLLETFKTGSYIIPAITLHYRLKRTKEEGDTVTPEIYIEIMSTLDEKAADIRDINPPVFLRKSYHRLYILLTIIFGILALIGILFFLFFRKKREKSVPVPPPLSAHEIAYKELEKLQLLGLTSKRQIREYYYYLSNIVRHYIENRFELMAPERTTEEFLTEMITTHKLDEMHKELIRNFLEHSDLVKFAGYAPENQEIEDSYCSAKRLIDETKEVLEKVLP
ncbi:MAG: BatD family protein [Candidatus Scalindua sp.]|nr:BatD family protein [Candidatus Scalindua sp.]